MSGPAGGLTPFCVPALLQGVLNFDTRRAMLGMLLRDSVI